MSRPDRAAAVVVCVGGAVLDRTLRLHAWPVPGTSNPARMSTGLGGVARNVAENLARLGVPVALVSRVGDDPSGRELLDGLDRLGIDRSGVVEVPGTATAQYVALLDPEGELVIAAAAMELFDGFAVDDLAARFEPGALVFAETNLPAPVLAALLARARAARDAGARLVLDCVSTAKVVRLPADLTGVGVLLGNVDEVAAWLAAHAPAPGPAPGEEELARRLLAAGPEAVVLTLGARGALVADRSGCTLLPAGPTRVVDVTGAGDALVAGTIAGLVRGEPLRAAVRRGIGLAGRTVGVAGSVYPSTDRTDRTGRTGRTDRTDGTDRQEP